MRRSAPGRIPAGRRVWLYVHVDDGLVELLLAAALHGFMRAGVLGNLLERQAALLEELAFARIVGGVALPEHLLVGRVVEDVGGDEQRAP